MSERKYAKAPFAPRGKVLDLSYRGMPSIPLLLGCRLAQELIQVLRA